MSSDPGSCEAAIKSVENCLTVLQGDLHQPGAPAIVLKLASSWQTIKTLLLSQSGKQLQDEQPEGTGRCVPGNGEEMSSQAVSTEGDTTTPSGPGVTEKATPSTTIAADDDGEERLQVRSSETLRSADGLVATSSDSSTGPLPEPSTARGQGEDNTGPSTAPLTSLDPPEPPLTDPSMNSVVPDVWIESVTGPSISETLKEDPPTAPQTEPLTEGTSDPPTAPSSEPSTATEPAMGEEYQKVEYPVLYYHKTSGYLYDPSTQQFYAPSSYYQDDTAAAQQQLNGDGTEAGATVAQCSVDSTSEPTQSQPALDYNLSLPAEIQQNSQPVQNYNVSSQPSQDYSTAQSTGQTSAAPTASIADVLAAVSDRALDRCGYQYDEYLDMFYDASSNLYYHQESKLYYDADLGCYYEYDFENKKYSLHSRVELPEATKKARRKERSSSPEYIFEDPLEEGEIRLPHIPHGSPPPEEDWAPCIRAVVTESDKLPKGTLFVITQDGAMIGREPVGSRGTLVTIPELKVSKLHADVRYDKHEKSFMIRDLGSVNGTFLNKDQRLSESKERSQPCPLVHGHTLTLGSTTLNIHIHNGWETCAWCDPSRARGMFQEEEGAGEGRQGEGQEELGVQRRKELNRIKKKYGLRTKDTYGEKVELQTGYSDRSETRRKTVGSDMPYDSQRPDDAPASVNEPIKSRNKGRKLLEGMGWKEGQGLGKSGAGIKDPVREEVRGDSRAGLGSSKNFSRSLDTAGGVASTAKRSVRNRYEEVTQRNEAKRRRLELNDL